MSLNTVTSGVSGVGSQLPNQVESVTDNAQKVTEKPLQQVQDTTGDVTDDIMPGEFPSDDQPSKQSEPQGEISVGAIWTAFSGWICGLFPRAMDSFEWLVQWLVDRYLPPPRQAAIYEKALNRPIASTFLVCQLICCGVPLLVFLVGVFLFAAVALLLYVVLALLILGPVLLVASMMGVSLWGWGWVVYGLVKWIDQKFLGGMLNKFWFSKVQAQSKAEGDQGEGEPTDRGEKKDN
ncbi:hypothetical protein N7470_002202 [Penicillium chermesinum]|nr:hypothetical protein N7470_002202 [Penicillium chermesinum]